MKFNQYFFLKNSVGKCFAGQNRIINDINSNLYNDAYFWYYFNTFSFKKININTTTTFSLGKKSFNLVYFVEWCSSTQTYYF